MTEGRRKYSDDVSTVLSTRDLPPVRVASFCFTVIAGPDAGAYLTVDETAPQRTYVGKSPLCELRLSDPKVSRRHFAVEVVDGAVRLSDLSSTNGTWVNGVQAFDVTLRGGEIIVLGDTQIRCDPVEPTRMAVSRQSSFGRVMGSSPEMRRLYPLCQRLAASDVPLVIEGETGTGKEVLAESLHDASPRGQGPFVVCDCTAISPNLMESALFGHERGAFTGATALHKGFFEQAHGGTLLLDEIGDLDIALQAKLLRAIERHEVRRVGGDRWIKVDVRVMGATRRDLEKEIQAGRFRDDLFYRLAVARIELPPLRERRGDIATLAGFFWSQLGGGETPIPHDFLLRLEAYGWPGNVRELRNTIARRLALGDLALDTLSAGPESVGFREGWTQDEPQTEEDMTNASPPAVADLVDHVLGLNLPLSDSRAMIVEDFERRYIQNMLDRHGGDASRAAAAAGVARRYFQLLRAKRTTP